MWFPCLFLFPSIVMVLSWIMTILQWEIIEHTGGHQTPEETNNACGDRLQCRGRMYCGNDSYYCNRIWTKGSQGDGAEGSRGA
jgi:hypothetical protein